MDTWAVTSGMTPEVLVIGGGAIGAAAAYELASRGIDTVLLERGADLAAGCSYGNAGLVCPSHAAPLAQPSAILSGIRWMFDRTSPFYLRPRPAVLPWLARFTIASTARRARAGARAMRPLAIASLELHAQYFESGVDTGFKRLGIIDTYDTEQGLAGAVRDAASHPDGFPFQVLTDAEARDLEPALERVAGALYFPTEAHLDGHKFVVELARAAARSTVRIQSGVTVTAIRRRGDRIEAVETTQGTFRPGAVVVAAGAWSRGLARQVGIPIPLEGGKGYHVDLPPAEGDPRIPLSLQEARIIVTPLGRALRIAGTLELAGLDLSVDRVRVDAVRKAAEARVRGLAGRPVTEVWSGLRPCAADGMPIIGRSREIQNLIIATGHGMMGLAFAPITGRLVAELSAGEAPSQEISMFSPDRFRVRLRNPGLEAPRKVA